MALQTENPPADTEAAAGETTSTTESKAEDTQLNGHDANLSSQPTWDGPSDPSNPYNWPSRRKIAVGIVCSASQLVTTMSASMIAPALDQILADLHMAPSAGQLAFSVFFLGLGLAPFLVAPLAELYGRRVVWLGGNAWYILWNALCPVGLSSGMIIIGRLLAASGASVGITLTGPVLADMYPPKDRGKSLVIATILPYLGPALGPIVGGLAAQHLWWPWLFWILSIFDAGCLALGFFILRESYAPVILRHKARAQAASSDSDLEGVPKQPLRIRLATFYADLTSRLGPAIRRPIRLLIRRPIIQLLAIANAVNFGIYTLILSTFASLWITRYHQSETLASLHYIAIAIGAFICAQIGGRLMDFMWQRTRAANPEADPVPEWRLSFTLIGFVLSIAGLFWYAWAAEERVHWAVVDAGVIVFVCGSFMFSQGLLAYQVDEFTSKWAASASAASRLWTFLLGFGFPIFAPQLYGTLGYGWGTSLLGLIYAVIGLVIVFVLWIWGGKIRSIGRVEDEKEA